MQTPPPLPSEVKQPVPAVPEAPIDGKGPIWPWVMIFILVGLPPCLVYLGLSLGSQGMAGFGAAMLPLCTIGFGCVLPVALMKRGGGMAGAGCLGIVVYVVVEVAILFSGFAKMSEGF